MNAMKRAHEIRKEAAAKFNCKTSEIIFSICLEIAWAEIKENKMNDLKKAIYRFNGTIQVGGQKNWFNNTLVTVIAPLKCSDALEKDIYRLGIEPHTHPTLLGGFRVWKDLCIVSDGGDVRQAEKNADFVKTMIDLAGTNGFV